MQILGRSLLVVLALGGAALAVQTPPQLPPPFHTPSAMNRPTVIPRPEGVEVRVPPGFKVEVVAEGFEVPRFMLLGPSQEILLSDSARDGGGAVYVLRAGRDGRIEQKTKIVEGLNRPYGLALWKDYLYLAEPDSVKRCKYDPGAMKAASPLEEVVSLKGLGMGHWTRTLLFDRKGEKMYVTVGSASNVDAGEDPRRAAINRYDPDGSGHEIVATGLRNVIGLRWLPGTDTLWAATQERDGLGDDLVPDYFTSVKPGAFYGWPYAYIGPHEDPRRKGERPELVQKTVVPDVLLGAHVAVLDFVFYGGKAFPPEYRGGAFLAQHGSWNRSKRVGYNLAFVPFKDGRPAGEPREFLSGFMLAPDKAEVWGRPVGLLEMPDGSLLMTDDGGGRVWRISHGG
ncbi:MAG TPA: PQQ-dependent sugar dehydrogenase [Vicinamibacteria bacterium]|nr:PQQ-dependent sugar dehydrogenase [Vicinamibacteria bacterium]